MPEVGGLVEFFDMISEDDFLKAIRKDADVQRGLDELATEVKSYWQEIGPVDTGNYIGDIRIRKLRDKDGVPIRRVSNLDPASHIIEYGSNDTPKFGVRARVATHFGYEPEE